MIFLNRTLKYISIKRGGGWLSHKDIPWYHKWNLRLSTLCWFSYAYWVRFRPLRKKIKKLEEEIDWSDKQEKADE